MIARSQLRKLHSAIVGQDDLLKIQLPDGYEAGTRRYPVLLLPDGDDHFGTATDMAQMLTFASRLGRYPSFGRQDLARSRALKSPARFGRLPSCRHRVRPPTVTRSLRYEAFRFAPDALWVATNPQFRSDADVSVMITHSHSQNRRLSPVFAGTLSVLSLLAGSSTSLAASWSPAVLISSSQPSTAPNAFAFNPSGNEVWATAPGVSGGAVVQVAERSFGGAWSALSTIATIRSVGVASVQDLSVSDSANGHVAVAWSVGGGVEIALRSPAGVWQPPVGFASEGGASSLVAKLDAQGDGVAVWSRLTSTASVVEAVTWTAAGTFGNVVQLSPSSQGAFLPDLAINETGTAVAVWQVAAPLDDSSPNQVEAAILPAGGSWGAASAASPVAAQTWNAHVALDGAGNANVVWEQGAAPNGYHIFAASRSAGGTWRSPARIEPADWYMAGRQSVAADTAGNVTASWVVEDASGAMSVRAATLPAGGVWSAPSTLGQLRSSGGVAGPTPPVAAARDGSIAVVGWAAPGTAGALASVAVRLGLGSWVPMVIGGNPPLTQVLATSNARASVVWPVPNGVKYHHALKQSDYQ